MFLRGRSWLLRATLLLSLLAGFFAAIVGLGGFDSALLDLAPLALLLAIMLTWPYPGAELIAGLIRRRSRRRSPASLAPRARAPRRSPHGGRLISLSLGGRAPPAPAGCA